MFSKTFYQNVHRILKADGILVGQSESPRFHTQAFQDLFGVYNSVFGPEKTWCFLVFISTYPTGMWGFCYCSKGDIDPFGNFDKSLSAKFTAENDLNYYNEDVHTAAFALPGFVKELVKA